MALVPKNVNALYIKTLSSEIEQNFYTENEADLLQKVKDYINKCIFELVDTKKQFICFLQTVDVNNEGFYNFVRLKNARLSNINKVVEGLRKKLQENNEKIICCIKDNKDRKEELSEKRFCLESEKEHLEKKIELYEAEYQQIDSEIMKVAQDLDTTSNQCEKGRIGMGIGLGIGLMAAALPFAAVATPIIVLGAAIGIRSAKNLTDAANDNNILVEQYQDLQEFFVSLNDEIQDVYQNINSICHSLDVLPERIKELTNKNNIFSKIFLFVIEFLIIARNCHLPLKHIITICEANRPPPSNLKKLLKRNKEELAGKVTNVIAENMKHFDRISNQTLDYQIKLKAIETSALSSNEFRAYHIRRNLLADSNPNGKNSVSQNADYRWDFVGPWKYGTPVFLHTHYDPEFEDKFDTCYETSCSNCKKTLTIDLNDIGMTHIVNTFQPLITFSEWVVNRADCGSIYQSSIYLLDSSHRVIAVEEGKTEFQQWQLQKWEKLELRIQSYPSETRYIRIESSGKDTQFWAGHYGVKIAESELKIHFDDIPPMNLLNDVNPKGDEVTRYADSRWHFNGAWKYDVPVFLDNHFHPNFEDKFEYCFETSYMECKKVMEIDLKKVGILGLMDYFRPSIIFSEWVINRADCGSKYQCSLTLLNKWHKIIAEISDGRQFRKWHLQKWEKVKLEIHAYPPGVRYIQITSSGQDTQFWEGHYGVKIAGSELLLKLT